MQKTISKYSKLINENVQEINTTEMSAIITKVGRQNDGFKTEEELKKAELFFNYIPIYPDHPPADEMFYPYDKVLGYTTDAIFEDGGIKVKLKIFDNALDDVLKEIENQGIDLSIGYFATLEEISKREKENYNGASFLEKDIYPVHLAFVKKGACSFDDGCGVFFNEAKDNFNSKDEMLLYLKNEINRMQIYLNSLMEENKEVMENALDNFSYKENPGIEKISDKYWGFRVRNPDDFEKDSFRTIRITDGVNAIVGRLKGQKTMTIQSLRFKTEKFKTEKEVQKWIEEHKQLVSKKNKELNEGDKMVENEVEIKEEPIETDTGKEEIKINEETIAEPVSLSQNVGLDVLEFEGEKECPCKEKMSEITEPQSIYTKKETYNTMEETTEVPKENASGWKVPSNPPNYGKSTAQWNGSKISVDAPDSCFLFVNSDLPPSTGRVCPHHEPEGNYNVNRKGVISAYAAIKGARGGIRSDIPSDIVNRGLGHLRNHYKEFELKWPEEDESLKELLNEFFQPTENEVDITRLEKEIIAKINEKEKVVDNIIDRVDYSKEELMSMSLEHLKMLEETLGRIKIPETSTIVVNAQSEEKEFVGEDLTVGDLYSKRKRKIGD